MSKQDRQGVRTAKDLEQKYDFGLLSKAKSFDSALLNRLNFELNDFRTKTSNNFQAVTETLEVMQGAIEDCYPKNEIDTKLGQIVEAVGYTNDRFDDYMTEDESRNTFATKDIASAEKSGLMSAEHFSKLDALPNKETLEHSYLKKAEFLVHSSDKTTNANGNISTELSASSYFIIGASFIRDTGTTVICTVYTNGGNLGIHVTDNSGAAVSSVSGTLRYLYIKL